MPPEEISTITSVDSGPGDVTSVDGERAPDGDRTIVTGGSALSLGSDTTIDLPGPESVLRKAEIEQSRRTAISGMLFNVIGLIGAPFFGGDPVARWVFVFGLCGAFANNLFLFYLAHEDRHENRLVAAYFVAAPITNIAVLYYLGVFGPAVVIFVLNIYSACLGYGKRIARITLYGSMAPMALLGSAVALGLVEDKGLITISGQVAAPGRTIVVLGFLLFLYLVYLQARATRRVMVSSLLERDIAVRTSAHREAMFLEARQDLERALHAGGMGRFTDQTLGDYKLGSVIGRGGMGEVYEATHLETGEPAAVKMLLPEVLSRPDYVRRFMREVRIAASLDSPNVVRVLAVGDESAPLPYLAMELLRGEDLAHRLRRVERLAPGEVVELVRQAGRAVTAAAEAGIVHRDLKPQNLFITDDPEPVWKVLDFGVSKLVAGVTITQGETVGTPQYMAPEQARGADVDVRTDLYALGAIAYRAITGLPPFGAHDASEVLVAVLREMPVRPSLVADVPPQVDRVLSIALAKEPEERFANAADLADALEAALAGELSQELKRRANELEARHPWSDVR